MKQLLASLAISAVIALPGLVSAQTTEERGLEIAVEADRRNQGFGDTSAHMQMSLINKRGDRSIRSLRVMTLEQEEDGDKSLTIFNEPKDVRGTAFLSYTHVEGPDDQWLFLPALKRVKRISSNNKSGPFMGSEFSYEDLGSQEVAKYTYNFLRDDELDGTPVFVFERRPTDKKSGYTRHIVYMDQENYNALKIEFFDRKDTLLKTLVSSGFTLYQDKFWRAHTMLMVNHQTGKQTELVWSDYKFQTGLTENDFSQNSLKRAR